MSLGACIEDSGECGHCRLEAKLADECSKSGLAQTALQLLGLPDLSDPGFNKAVDAMVARLFKAACDERKLSGLSDIRDTLNEVIAERDSAEANFLACARAIGVTYDAEGLDQAPGPVEDVVAAINNANFAASRVEQMQADWDASMGQVAWEQREACAKAFDNEKISLTDKEGRTLAKFGMEVQQAVIRATPLVTDDYPENE